MLTHRDWDFWDNSPRSVDPKRYDLLSTARAFVLIAIIYTFSVAVYHFAESVPFFTLIITRRWFKRHVERVRNYLEFYQAIKLYIKATVVSAISLVGFAIVFPKTNYSVVGKLSSGSSPTTWDRVLFQVNIIVLFGSIIIGIEKLILKLIATRFHKTAFKERIEKQRYATWVLDRLSRAREAHPATATSPPMLGSFVPPSSVTALGSSYGEKSGVYDAEGAASRKNLLGGSRSVPQAATPQEFSPPTTFSNKSTFTKFFNNNNPGASKGNSPFGFVKRLGKIKDAAIKGGVDVNSREYAARLARKLFSALHGTRNYLIVDDFLPYFDTEEDAIKAFEFFDRDGNGDISKKEMRDRVLTVYRERKALTTALHDMSQIVGKLDNMGMVMALLIIIIIALIVFALDPLKSLATLGTLFVGWSFIFGNTFKTIFECVIFLFMTHPYDPGDIIVVGTSPDWLTVEKVKLLSTVFYRTDGTYTVIPNNFLATQPIYNMRRSKSQSESIPIKFDFSTTPEQLEELKRRMNAFVEANPREFVAPIAFNVDTLTDTHHVTVNVGITHKANFQDGARRWRNRTKFAFALKDAINELKIGFTIPAQTIVATHNDQVNSDDDSDFSDEERGHDGNHAKNKNHKRKPDSPSPFEPSRQHDRNKGNHQHSAQQQHSQSGAADHETQVTNTTRTFITGDLAQTI
ncbi:hypothetical protein EV182_001323 [Spiromyces aspiralis]|uniref:Uncharacterized protein n=1 Tax=Spiromyces aspiralis TaxID=68401 RepID=A0ACC1HM67_9FUNG|nr:hypothetical protein EV182_001323 [Spiromyces aspiralis]